MNESRLNRLINVVSIIIPVVVAALFGIKIPDAEPLTFLPPIYASINAVTAVLLILAVWAIKNNRRSLHQKLMTSCVILSGMFLLMYVTYHMTSESTSYGGDGVLRPVYFFILISHILLSIAVVPLVLKTYARAYLKQFEKHKKLAKITFPLWLYVAISGVVVYVMISPYYV